VNTIIVINDDNQIISKTTSAMARKLLAKKDAVVVSRNPFIIQLLKYASFIPIKETFKMEPRNLMTLIKNEEPIYLLNLKADGQITMHFRTLYGEPKPFRVPKGSLPVNISDEYTYEELKNFTDLRRVISKGWVRVMNQEDRDAFLLRRSSSSKKSLDKIKEETDKAQRMTTAELKAERVTGEELEEMRRTKEAMEKVEMDSIVRPRIIGLCQRLSKDSDNPIDPMEALEELELLAPTEDESNYILTHSGGNAIIKKWVLAKQIDGLEESEIEAAIVVSEISDKKVRPKIKTKKSTKK